MLADAPEKRITELEEELYWVRRNIVELMPKDISEALSSYRSCSTVEGFAKWQRETANFIISKAEVDPKQSGLEPRGWCPLCQGGVRYAQASGFKIPGGLEKHLNGEGNAYRCVVTDAAFRNAEYKLREALAASAEAARQAMEERRRNEQTYLTDPSLPSQLLDEGQWWIKSRSTEEVVAAEKRLLSLNFEKEVSGNVIAYKLQHEGRLVFADPRVAGRITFKVFNGGTTRKGNVQASFNLPDVWKKNLPEKFLGLLNEACSRVPTRRRP
jgi:hypothetical protein